MGNTVMPCFDQPAEPRLSDLQRCCDQVLQRGDFPHASGVDQNVVIYDRAALLDAPDTGAIKAELAHCLSAGPGVFLVRGAYGDRSLIERSNVVFAQLADAEARQGERRGDHFGNNQRIWNAVQKTALADPELFVAYYANPLIHLVATAWLGPWYRITAQVNNVLPGGRAQQPHRDYHLGFQSAETVAEFPLHAQQMSQFLTLQGAIAHSDMPCRSGPTLLLPFSQQYAWGYLAAGQPEFVSYFQQRHCQLPLAAGDALFFNPALIHAGGANDSDQDRIANLLQISSAMGRTMESLHHRAMIQAVYPVLLQTRCSETIANIIATVADGYSFPTNLDSDPPIDGKAPASQQALLRSALANGTPWPALAEQLEQYQQRRRA